MAPPVNWVRAVERGRHYIMLHKCCIAANILNLFGGGDALSGPPGSAPRSSGLRPGAREFSGNPDRILDRVAVGRAVADDGDAFQPEQRRTAVLGIVEALLEFLEGFDAPIDNPPGG